MIINRTLQIIVESHQGRPARVRNGSSRDIRGKQKCDYKERLYTHGGYHSWDADVVKNPTANEVEQITKSKKRSREIEDSYLAKYERFYFWRVISFTGLQLNHPKN